MILWRFASQPANPGSLHSRFNHIANYLCAEANWLEYVLFHIVTVITMVWFIYAIIIFVHTFLIVGRRNLKKRLEEGITDKRGFS